MANNNGCLAQGGLILTWIILIFTAIDIFAFSAIWGVVFTVVVVVVKIATRTKKELDFDNQKNTAEISQITGKTKTSATKNHNINNYANNYILRSYFINITQEVEKIISQYERLCSDSDFLKVFNENTNLKITINGSDSNIKEQIRTLFLVDMTKCFIDLGHEFNPKNKEGFGLFYFFVRTNGLEKFGFDKLNIVLSDDLCKSVEDMILQVKSSFEINQAIDEIFLMSKILGDYDNDQRQKYLVMLYRYASLTAKADRTVNDTEAEWLSKILSLSQKPSINGNVVISNSGENDTESSVKRTKPIKPKTSKLKSLIGLTSVKEEIETLTNFIKIQQARETKGLKTSSVSYHCVFTGNPGTGKTTVARIVADIYKSLGILDKGHLVETDRSGLVAEYVGQTAVKTNKIIDSALDGVLFIDEAYSLVGGSENDYGKEAIATLLKRMEDNRDRLVVILAGYSAEMQQFIDSNPGLQSRFNRYIEFPDYSADELYQIFELNLKKFDYVIAENAVEKLKEIFKNAIENKYKNFGNARFVRNFFEKTLERQANRLSGETNLTTENLSEICEKDIVIA
ncbi:MAG: AAA family ATPase [Prevotellaceae bacterium]|jgi:AAA+ superfamily predicted ATPase|nr:AAA family ATPase [Prevotellaceae bacterium]